MDEMTVPTRKPPTKPRTWRTLCVSTYQADLDHLDALVAELKRRGRTDMSRSQLIRLAIEQLDLDEIATKPP